MNDNLDLLAKICFSNTFVFYHKAHTYHWNVEGVEFPYLHVFFGDVYEEVYASVDKFAEEIRTLDRFPPKTLTEIAHFSHINSGNSAVNGVQMLQDLFDSNQSLIESLNKLFDALTANSLHGFADFIASRIDSHKKHEWMLRSTLKKI